MTSRNDKSSINCPCKFEALTFPIWKVKMTVFLQSLGSCIAKGTTKRFVQPNGDENIWSETTVKDYEANAKATYTLMQALNDDLF